MENDKQKCAGQMANRAFGIKLVKAKFPIAISKQFYPLQNKNQLIFSYITNPGD